MPFILLLVSALFYYISSSLFDYVFLTALNFNCWPFYLSKDLFLKQRQSIKLSLRSDEVLLEAYTAAILLWPIPGAASVISNNLLGNSMSQLIIKALVTIMKQSAGNSIGDSLLIHLRLMYASLLSFFPRLDCVVIKDASLVKLALVLLFANYVATPTSEKCALPLSPSCVWRIYDAWKGRRCQREEIKEVNNLVKNAALHTRSSFALLWLHGRLFYQHFCSLFLTLVDM